MNVPGENHRDAFFSPLFKQILEETKYLFQTKEGTPFIFPGAQNAALGSAVPFLILVSMFFI